MENTLFITCYGKIILKKIENQEWLGFVLIGDFGQMKITNMR